MFFERGPLRCEFFDACLGGGDDGMSGVVVFFEAEALSAHGLVELRDLPLQGGNFELVVVFEGAERLHQLVVQEA